MHIIDLDDYLTPEAFCASAGISRPTLQRRTILDPTRFVIGQNILRRHLTSAQKSELIAKLLKANPEQSDRAVAKIAKVHNETVAAVRAKGEASDEIRHIPPTERVDAGGRKRARKTAAVAKAPKAEIDTAGREQSDPEAESNIYFETLEANLGDDELFPSDNPDRTLELGRMIIAALSDAGYPNSHFVHTEQDRAKGLHVSDGPEIEIKVIARNRWQTEALANEPTTPEEATIRYNAIDWEIRAIEWLAHDLRKTQGKTLVDAKRFFPNGRGYKKWLQSHKTCPMTTHGVNVALSAVGYQPSGAPYAQPADETA
jgi:hypothetical protein